MQMYYEMISLKFGNDFSQIWICRIRWLPWADFSRSTSCEKLSRKFFQNSFGVSWQCCISWSTWFQGIQKYMQYTLMYHNLTGILPTKLYSCVIFVCSWSWHLLKWLFEAGIVILGNHKLVFGQANTQNFESTQNIKKMKSPHTQTLSGVVVGFRVVKKLVTFCPGGFCFLVVTSLV